MGVRHERQPIGTCLPARLRAGDAVACRHGRTTMTGVIDLRDSRLSRADRRNLARQIYRQIRRPGVSPGVGGFSKTAAPRG